MRLHQENTSLPVNKYLIVGASSEIALSLIDLIIEKDPQSKLYLLARNIEKVKTHIKNIQQLPGISIVLYDMLTQKIPAKAEWNINYVIIFPGTIPQNPAEYANSLIVNFSGIIEMTEVIVDLYLSTLKNILITTSTAGIRVRKNNYIYGSAKAGLTGYCSGLRHRLYPGIHVTTLIPGFIQTRMTEGLKLPKLLVESPQRYAQKIYAAISMKKNFVYSSFQWKLTSFILRNIPESVLLRIGYQAKIKTKQQ
jgi:decaprenylphospho-beta-D-erythro-pentofuranosid-2-ulose 2-reductase